MEILDDSRELKQILAICHQGGSKTIQSIKDSSGETVSDKQKIANAFADFYEKLYMSLDAPTDHPLDNDGASGVLEPITLKEVIDAMKYMKRGKAMDEKGIIAEMLKDGTHSLAMAVLSLFNDVLSSHKPIPDEWRRTKLIVIFKKGDPAMTANYRPIAILPILYKLFSRVLCDRLQLFLMPFQSIDQAAYRKGFSTEDHLLTVSKLIEKAREFNFHI